MTGKPAFYAKPPFVALGILGFLLSLTGCTGERSKPGGPGGDAALPAMSVLDDPVIGYTGWITSPDSLSPGLTEYSIPIPDSVYSALTDIDDILLDLSYRADTGFPVIELFDHEQDRWREIPLWTDLPVCDIDWMEPLHYLVRSGPHQYLSEHSDNPVEVFLGKDRSLKVRGDISAARIRLYDFRSDYVPVRLASQIAFSEPSQRTGWPPIARAVTIVENEVWAVLTYPPICGDREPFGPVNELVIIDVTGTVVERTLLDHRWITSMAYHNEEVWAILNSGFTLGTVERDGRVTELFDLPPWDGWRLYYRSMVSAMGRLFVTNSVATILLGILTDESLAADSIVVDWPLSLGDRQSTRIGLAWDGAYFYRLYGRHLRRYNLSREMTGEWILKVGAVSETAVPAPPSTGGIVWDGEAFWLLHYGPRRHTPTGVMLSRFKLPEDAR